ncbi:hypothetical protein PR048_003866 [Dryococelus australis]|uniref:Uncharacterized protein n=1 Tax=Dryococelus australis TaxID=614101 RepID=A0ABQ9IQ19_9NEOP|nr:hypothetical protein PR048_003866 [Dryococelus australis]
MDQCENERAEEPEDNREKKPTTSGIVRYDSDLRISGVTRPGNESWSPWWEASRLTAQPPRPPLSRVAAVYSVSPGPTLVTGSRCVRRVCTAMSKHQLTSQRLHHTPLQSTYSRYVAVLTSSAEQSEVVRAPCPTNAIKATNATGSDVEARLQRERLEVMWGRGSRQWATRQPGGHHYQAVTATQADTNQEKHDTRRPSIAVPATDHLGTAHCRRGVCGGVVSHASFLSRAGVTANRVRFPARSLSDSRTWKSCRTMEVVGRFSRGSPFPRRCSILTSLHPHRLSRLRYPVARGGGIVQVELQQGFRKVGMDYKNLLWCEDGRYSRSLLRLKVAGREALERKGDNATRIKCAIASKLCAVSSPYCAYLWEFSCDPGRFNAGPEGEGGKEVGREGDKGRGGDMEEREGDREGREGEMEGGGRERWREGGLRSGHYTIDKMLKVEKEGGRWWHAATPSAGGSCSSRPRQSILRASAAAAATEVRRGSRVARPEARHRPSAVFLLPPHSILLPNIEPPRCCLLAPPQLGMRRYRQSIDTWDRKRNLQNGIDTGIIPIRTNEVRCQFDLANFLDLVKLYLHEAEEPPQSRTSGGQASGKYNFSIHVG